MVDLMSEDLNSNIDPASYEPWILAKVHNCAEPHSLICFFNIGSNKWNDTFESILVT